MIEELKKYKHVTEGQVRFHEVDSYGVVHNIQYMYFFEWARVKYLEAIGHPVETPKFVKDNFLMVVHQEADFMGSAKFFDEYEVFTRTAKIGDSSITIENLLKLKDGKVITRGNTVFVNLNTKTGLPETISMELKDKIRKYEGIDL
ncbi:MAG: thioesterase family protein [bacterium]